MRFMYIVTPARAAPSDARTDGRRAQACRARDQGRPHARQGRADAVATLARRCGSRDGQLGVLDGPFVEAGRGHRRLR